MEHRYNSYRFWISALFFFLSLGLHAQVNLLRGRVVDEKSGEGLPFVNILFNNSKQGTTSNLDGYFEIQQFSDLKYLRFSYVGYEEKLVSISGSKTNDFLMVPLDVKTEELQEVRVLPGVNPAHRIIDLVLANRDRNDPEKLASFSYMAYHKMHFDLAQYQKGKLSDEEEKMLEEFFENQHLFFFETVSERKFKAPDRSKEKVIASRLSGFKNPEFSLLATQMQSFSFYNDFIALSDIRYLSPIAPGSTGKYLFLLEDTIYTPQKDTVFIISFRPRKGKNFKGLKGTVYVNSRGYALQNVIAEPEVYEKGINVKVQQKYELVDGVHWFPVQLNTQIRMDGMAVSGPGRNMSFLGEGKSYLMNIQINPQLDDKEFDEVEVEITPEAYTNGKPTLDRYRTTELSPREKETYRVLDSLGQEHNLDRKLDAYMSLIWGKVPVGFLDLELNRIVNFDAHQGLRLGLGLSTNDHLLKWMEVGGYGAYGFKDDEWKYGSHLKLHPFEEKNNYLVFNFADDVVETGESSFLDDKSMNSSESFRKFLLREMDGERLYRAGMGVVLLPSLRMEAFLKHSRRSSLNGYAFQIGDEVVNRYHFTEAGLMFRFAYGEKFLKTQRHKISLGTQYPMVWCNLSRGLDRWKGDYEYTRVEAKVKANVVSRGLGKSELTLMGGLIDGKLPVTALFNNRPGFNKSEPIAIDNSFNTMRMDEFSSNRYMALFFKQDFGSLLFSTPKFKPELALVHHMGWGELDDPELHLNTEVKSMDKGYFESGIQINSLMKDMLFNYGVGVYYRYGPYAMDKTSDNFAIKMTLGFSF